MPNTPASGAPLESVARLYEVFKSYRLGEFDSCSHCVAPEEHERLASNPLRVLEVSDLNRYAQKALTTWGSVNDFKHFLPRLLELTLDHYFEFTMPEVLLSKLAYAEWSEWPPVECDAVRRFLEAFWHHQLAKPLDYPRDDRMVTVLGGLAEAEGSVAKYLTLWESARELNAALHLAALVNQVADEVVATQSIRLWTHSDSVSHELVAWLTSDAPCQILEPFRKHAVDKCPTIYGDLTMMRSAVGTDL